MTFKTVAATSFAIAMLAGSAFAQEAATPKFNTDAEKQMYTSNQTIMKNFFTDETYSTLKSDDEVKSAFGAMDATSQAGMKAACEKAAADRGSYGTVTNSLCDSVMKM